MVVNWSRRTLVTQKTLNTELVIMGFKQKSNKDKKKAKSKKTNKLNKAASAREWDYEGGQVLEEYPAAPEGQFTLKQFTCYDCCDD